MDRMKLEGPLASLARVKQAIAASRPRPGTGGNPGHQSGPALTLSAAARDLPGGGNALRELAAVLPALGRPGAAEGLPPAALALLDKLLKAFPTLQDLRDPARLRQAMGNSGLFLEARLAGQPAGRHSFDADLKALLARLGRSLETGQDLRGIRALREYGMNASSAMLPGGVGRHRLQLRLGEALSRITRLQGETLEAQEKGEARWSFDLPVTLRDQALVIPIRVERQRGGESEADEEDGWRVAFALEMERLGLVQMDVLLREKEVRLAAQAARADTLALLQKHRRALREQFRHQGMSLETTFSRLQADDEALE